MDNLLQALRAAGEQTRMRILALCAERELTVTDLIHILGQTQSRVSRHLKILVEAGLLDRFQEGQWARYRIAGQGSLATKNRNTAKEGVSVARYVMQNMDMMHPMLRRDREILARHQASRRQQMTRYFEEHAKSWAELREQYVDQDAVDEAVSTGLLEKPVRHFLDIGTGAGHTLELLGPKVGAAIGIDISAPMLDLARTRIEEAGLTNCQARQADMMALPYDDNTFDAALFNMVLHYVDVPDIALWEAARVLGPDGRLAVVDFAAHNVTALRDDHAHQWLGFPQDKMEQWLEAAGFQIMSCDVVSRRDIDVFLLLAIRSNS